VSWEENTIVRDCDLRSTQQNGVWCLFLFKILYLTARAFELLLMANIQMGTCLFMGALVCAQSPSWSTTVFRCQPRNYEKKPSV
jgi:hypothetical protein